MKEMIDVAIKNVAMQLLNPRHRSDVVWGKVWNGLSPYVYKTESITVGIIMKEIRDAITEARQAINARMHTPDYNAMDCLELAVYRLIDKVEELDRKISKMNPDPQSFK